VCGELTQAGTALKKIVNPLHMQVFWIPASISHVSLVNTGRIRTDLVPMVIDAVRSVLAETEPFTLSVKGMKLCEVEKGDELFVRSIWALVEESSPLADLRARVLEVFEEMDIQANRGDYEPHVPLALVDDFRNTREFSSAFVEWQDHGFGDIQVAALLIKKAETGEGSGGRPFAVLANLPFKSN